MLLFNIYLIDTKEIRPLLDLNPLYQQLSLEMAEGRVIRHMKEREREKEERIEKEREREEEGEMED